MGARVLVVGLDGADWALVDQFGPERMPNLHRLRVRGPLRSTTPPMTLPAWCSVITGVEPGRHGIYDFVRRAPGERRLELLNSTHRRVPTMFRVLSERGRRVASVAVPTTWPPEPVLGAMISGFDSPVATRTEAAHYLPVDLYAEIDARFGALRFADFQEGELGAGWHTQAHRSLLREIARKEAICRWLLRREDWSVFMVVFGESDTVAHHFWAFHDPASPRHRPGLPHAIADVYERLDAALGTLMAEADTVVVASDHGFGGAGDLAIYLNRWLEAEGWLRFRPGRRGRWGDELRTLTMRLPVERIVRRVPPRLLAGIETGNRYGDLDFAQTRAWSDEMNYAATLHLADGVDPAPLIERLLAWELEGRRVVERVQTADEVWGADRAPGAPDLVLTLALRDGYSVTVLPSGRVPAGTTWRRLTGDELLGGKGLGMNGSHRQYGVFAMGGEGVGPPRTVDAAVADVAPTVFALLGEPVPDHMTGRVQVQAAVDRVAWTGTLGAPRAHDAVDAAGVARRLRTLGYL